MMPFLPVKESSFEQKLCPNLATLCCDIFKVVTLYWRAAVKIVFRTRVRYIKKKKQTSAVVMSLCVELFSFHRMITKKNDHRFWDETSVSDTVP